MDYTPGVHLIATLKTEHTDLLLKADGVRSCIDQLIEQHNLRKLGEVYHNFSTGGFTAVVCLSESHLSIHTWPEFNKVNLDIYLSNYQRVNDGAVDNIYMKLVEYFQAMVESETSLRR